MNILLITPPFTQLNCPYPATTQLKAYVESVTKHRVVQKDMSIDVINKIYTKEWLQPLFDEVFQRERLSQRAKSVAMNKERYLNTVDSVVRFLQGKDNSLATRIATSDFLPQGSRFRKVDDDGLDWAFGTTGTLDKARHIASLYITDLADFIADMTTRNFSLIRYGEQLALSAPIFDWIEKEVEGKPEQEMNRIDRELINFIEQYIDEVKPELIGFTVPFPGTLYATLKCSKYIKKNYPNIKVAIGGGYVNTELRQLSDVRIFNYVDYILYDDGELSLESLISHIEGKLPIDKVVRLKYAKDGAVADSAIWDSNVKFDELPAPSFEGFDVDKYISMIEMSNPMHKMWSDGFWNKMTVAHGCYWAKCTFCDTKLDYINRYDAPTAQTVVDRMESIIKETGSTGFHFTDEALPPKLLKEIAQEIILRKLTVSYWGNIRFERSYDADMCNLLFESGCVAVSGGLEVASDRILKLINKGVTINQAVKVMDNMTSSGIMVHAYLMYGFPTQTMQESVDSLEIVRQMFEEGLLQSAFWHRYTMTVHSPTGCCPKDFGVERVDNEVHPFANNGVEHRDNSDIPDYNKLGEILYKATYNYMHGSGYDISLRNWFESKEIKPTIKGNFVAKIVEQ